MGIVTIPISFCPSWQINSFVWKDATPMDEKLSKGYEPHDVERKWYGTWEESGYFRADEKSAKPHYSIVIPPPNVTGVLCIIMPIMTAAIAGNPSATMSGAATAA